MTDKEMIEEILIEEFGRKCNGIEDYFCRHRTCNQCLIERLAERLSEKFQLKLPEGSVVFVQKDFNKSQNANTQRNGLTKILKRLKIIRSTK